MKISISKLFVAAFLFLAAAACKDEFLDKKPIGPVSGPTLAANEKGADALLISAYSLMDGWGGWDFGDPWRSTTSNWTFGSVTGGDAYKGSEANDQPDITPLERHEMAGSNPYIESKWRAFFNGVYRANQAISTYKALQSIDENVRKTRIAEGRFLRGLYYFELKRVYNKVPYIDETVEDVRVPNDKDIWPEIVADLQAAVADLPATQAQIGRATKGAANAMLGKAYLYQGKFSEAKAALDAVINSGLYSLAPKYHDNFNAETRNNSEGVLVVQQSVNDGAIGDNGGVGEVLNFTHSGGPGGCCGFFQPSQNLVNAFKTDANGLPLLDTYNDSDLPNDQGLKSSDPFTPYAGTVDPRLDWTVGRRGIPYLDWGPHPGQSWIRDQTYGGPYSPKKNVYYKSQENTYTDASGWTKGYTSNNIKLIRYADVLLMAAECEVEVGSLEKAREYVNMIRARAANPAGWVKTDKGDNAANYIIGLYNTSWSDKALARKAVRFERRLELGMEGHRFFDLVRWGIAAEEKTKYFAAESKKRTYLNGATFRAGINEYFPIPTKAITLSSKDGVATLTQNPGY